MTKRVLLSLSLLALSGLGLSAQKIYNPVLTAAPSMHITPDARGAGLGEQGVATSADIHSQYWNPAKYAFASSRAGAGVSYTPWLREVVDKVALMQFVGYYQLGKERRHALGASIRSFTLGNVERWDEYGNTLGMISPNEFAVDISYSIRLSESYSAAAALRYINSQLEIDPNNKSASAVVADLAFYMNRYIQLGNTESRWTAGVNLSNIGSKLNLDNGTTQYLPANLAIGTGLLYPIDKHNALSLTIEANKLLAPSYPRRGSYATEEAYTSALDKYNEGSGIGGIFRSFGDAPGGFSEELKEIRWSLGAEYNYKDTFFLRAGYSYMSPDKGSLQGFTAGAGFKLHGFRVDAAYLMSTIAQNPLDQTLRLSLDFDIDAIAKLFKK